MHVPKQSQKCMKKIRSLYRKFTLIRNVNPQKLRIDYKYTGSVSIAFIFCRFSITFNQKNTFRLRGAMAICASINFCNGFAMYTRMHQPRATDHQRLLTTRRQPQYANRQPLLTANSQPTTNHQPPLTANRQSTANPQPLPPPPTTANRQPPTNRQPTANRPLSANRQPTANRQPPTAADCQPATDRQPPTADGPPCQPPTANQG